MRTGRGAAVALHVVELVLVEVRRAVDPVHDLQRTLHVARALPDAGADPPDEGLRLLGEAQVEQRRDRERAVADPGVAVVPVALAPDLLGQARGRARPPGAPVGS